MSRQVRDWQGGGRPPGRPEFGPRTRIGIASALSALNSKRCGERSSSGNGTLRNETTLPFANPPRLKTARVPLSACVCFQTFKLWLPNGQASAAGRGRRPVRCTPGLGGKCFLLSFRHTLIVLASACHNPLHRLFAISLRKFGEPGLNGLLPDLAQFFNGYFFKGPE